MNLFLTLLCLHSHIDALVVTTMRANMRARRSNAQDGRSLSHCAERRDEMRPRNEHRLVTSNFRANANNN